MVNVSSLSFNLPMKTLLLLIVTVLLASSTTARLNIRRSSQSLGYVFPSTLEHDTIDSVKGDVYVLDPKWAIWHATVAEFLEFREKPSWFSPDPVEGFKLVATKESGKSTPDIYIKQCHVKAKTDLFPMRPLESLSRTRLLDLGMTKVPQDWHGRTAAQTSEFVTDFCKTLPALDKPLHGWRNWWDQDEVMLCPPIASKIECSHGFFCSGTKITEKVGFNEADKKEFVFVARDDIQKDAHRYTFFIIPTKDIDASKKWTMDELARADEAYNIFEGACKFANDLDKFIEEKLVKKREKEAEELLKPKRVLPWLGPSAKTKILANYNKYLKEKGKSEAKSFEEFQVAFMNGEITDEQFQSFRQ